MLPPINFCNACDWFQPPEQAPSLCLPRHHHKHHATPCICQNTFTHALWNCLSCIVSKLMRRLVSLCLPAQIICIKCVLLFKVGMCASDLVELVSANVQALNAQKNHKDQTTGKFIVCAKVVYSKRLMLCK